MTRARALIERVVHGASPRRIVEGLATGTDDAPPMNPRSYTHGFESVTPEMEELFTSRTNEHIRLVQKHAEGLAFRFPELADLPRQAANHDASKFGTEERAGYVRNTWTHKHEGQPYRGPEMTSAWEHHQGANDHHPEYWGEVSRMPDVALAHAVADWAAMSEELGTSLRAWVEGNAFKKWEWTPEQVRRIRELVAATGRP